MIATKGEAKTAGGMPLPLVSGPLTFGYISAKYWCYRCSSSHPKGDDHTESVRQGPGKYAVSKSKRRNG